MQILNSSSIDFVKGFQGSYSTTINTTSNGELEEESISLQFRLMPNGKLTNNRNTFTLDIFGMETSFTDKSLNEFTAIQSKLINPIHFSVDNGNNIERILNFDALQKTWLQNRNGVLNMFRQNKSLVSAVIGTNRLLEDEIVFMNSIIHTGLLKLLFPLSQLISSQHLNDTFIDSIDLKEKIIPLPGLWLEINHKFTRIEKWTGKQIIAVAKVQKSNPSKAFLDRFATPGIQLDYVLNTIYDIDYKGALLKIERIFQIRKQSELYFESKEIIGIESSDVNSPFFHQG